MQTLSNSERPAHDYLLLMGIIKSGEIEQDFVLYLVGELLKLRTFVSKY